MQYAMAEETPEWGVYVKFMIKDFCYTKYLIKSNVDFCNAEKKTEWVNEYVLKVQDRVLICQKYLH